MTIDPRMLAGDETGGAGEAKLEGRLTDLQEAEHLIGDSQWESALAILDRILALPSDPGAAVRRLRAIMEAAPELTGRETHVMGRDAEGRHLVKTRITMGGGLVPHIMTLRGLCLNQVLQKRASASAAPMEDDRVIVAAQIGLTHAAIVWEVLPSHAEALVLSGIMMAGTGRYTAAVTYYRKALEQDPGNARTRKLLEHAEEAARQTGCA